jgi:hypothetical protein
VLDTRASAHTISDQAELLNTIAGVHSDVRNGAVLAELALP